MNHLFAHITLILQAQRFGGRVPLYLTLVMISDVRIRCVLAGVLGLAATQQYYTLSDVASRVLPVLCPLTLDPDKDVRQHCFRTVRGFLGKLEKVSDDPSLREEMEADINSQTPSAAGGGSGWAGWAMGALTTVYRTTQRAKPKPGGQ